VAVRDRLLRDHVETVDYIDPITGEHYRPAPPPEDGTPDEDE
jgi:hypothetical protein